MSKYFVFSNTLKLAKAKNFCSILMSRSSWRDVMGGSTGVVVNENRIEYKDLDIEKLQAIKIPEAASFNLSAFCQIGESKTRWLRQPLGGSASVPEGLGSSTATIRVHSGYFQGLSLYSEFDNSYYYQALLANDFPELINRAAVHQISISVKLENQIPSENKTFAQHTDLCENELTRILTFIERMGLPAVPYDSFMDCMGHSKHGNANSVPAGIIRCGFRYEPGKQSEDQSPPRLCYTLIYDSLTLPQWRDITSTYQEWLLKESSAYRVGAAVNYGLLNWFSGYPQCVTMESRDLLRRECEVPQYDSYRLNYMNLEPETWEVREKRRKKVTEPRFMQLGECELANGCKLSLRLKMLKEGYVVILDFPTDDDMIRFADTELYLKTKWQSGAE